MARVSGSGSWLTSAAADTLQADARFDTPDQATTGRAYPCLSELSG